MDPYRFVQFVHSGVPGTFDATEDIIAIITLA
jgi:hypothetical protein